LPSTPTFGARLYELRTRSRLSQEEVAGRARLSKAYISGLENERRGAPSIAAVDAIAAAINANMAELSELRRLASEQRRATRVRVSTTVPPEVARLIRRLADAAPRLSPTALAQIGQQLEGLTM
jgi:transcriptional regulator with XRE-family HTH domain